MQKTLYKVALTYEYIVAAEDFDAAWQVARDAAREVQLDDDGTLEYVDEFNPGDTYPEGWSADCYAYGGESGPTIGEMLARASE